MKCRTFLFKACKRIRRFSETCFPYHAFSYRASYADPWAVLSHWIEQSPYDNSIDLKQVLPSSDIKRVLHKADQYCSKSFDLLGSGLHTFSRDVNWHLDFKSGFQWPPNLVHTRIRSNTPDFADLKIPWELSRFHHSVTMALAYRLTESQSYLENLKQQIASWIEDNKTGFGVNWACPMDVAIRAINWMAAIALIGDRFSTKQDSQFISLFVKSLWDHGCFLRDHLEWNGPVADSGANHLLTNLVGLFSVGCFFSDTRKGLGWLRYGHKHISNQTERQVLSDGVHFERSPAYHRLCTELLLWSKSLAKCFSYPFSDSFSDKLFGMQCFAVSCMKPSGAASLFGDNDTGRLLKPSASPSFDFTYLAANLKDKNSFFSLDRFLLDGTNCFSPCMSRKTAFPNGGLYLLSNNVATLFVRAGDIAYDGTHAHNDQLSFELTLGNQDIFVDRGTGSYLPKHRNVFRSTSAHNTFQINNAEQNRLGPGLFQMKDDTKTIVTEYDLCRLKAHHSGFKSLQRHTALYYREFLLAEDSLTILDSLSALQNGDSIVWHFHLAPYLIAENTDDGVRILSADGRSLCRVLPFRGANCIIKKVMHSVGYGEFSEAYTLHFSCRTSNTKVNSFLFNLTWSYSSAEGQNIE